MKELCRNFKCRKVILAFADAFIISMAALVAHFILSFAGRSLDRSSIVASIAVSSICCIGSLLITGAYSKLWRYFNRKDYLTCVYGAVVGIVVSSSIVYIINSTLYPLYTLFHWALLTFGICLFRYIFSVHCCFCTKC